MVAYMKYVPIHLVSKLVLASPSGVKLGKTSRLPLRTYSFSASNENKVT